MSTTFSCIAIFNFFATERAALLAETDYQKKYLPNGVLVNKIIGTEPINIEVYEKPGVKQGIINKCDGLIDKYDLKTSLRPNENESKKRWEWFLKFIEGLIEKQEKIKPIAYEIKDDVRLNGNRQFVIEQKRFFLKRKS